VPARAAVAAARRGFSTASHAYDPNLPCASLVFLRGSKQARGGRGRMVRNKARWRARYPTIPRFPLYYYSTIPVRCLVRQTNPISGRPERRLTAAGEKSYDEWDLERASENKANLSIADCGLRIGDRGKPHPARSSIAPNKPNSARPAGRPGPPEEEMCETNPILARQAEPMDLESAATACRPHPLRPLPALCGCDRAARAIECGQQCRGRRCIRWSAIARRKWHGDD
jgi:hypothetical protein